MHDQGGKDGPRLSTPDVAEYILQSRKIIAAIESAEGALIQVGAMASVVHLDGEIRKEERKLRQRSSEELRAKLSDGAGAPAVADADASDLMS